MAIKQSRFDSWPIACQGRNAERLEGFSELDRVDRHSIDRLKESRVKFQHHRTVMICFQPDQHYYYFRGNPRGMNKARLGILENNAIFFVP